MEILKERLKKLRKERDLKQADVAEAMNVARGTYASYENGITPTMDVCIKLAAYFGVTVDYLVCVSNEKKPPTGSLTDHFSKLAPYTGSNTLTSSDVSDLLEALANYYIKGAPCGDTPLKSLGGYICNLRTALLAATANDTPALMDSANAAVIAALEVTKMPAKLYESRLPTGSE